MPKNKAVADALDMVARNEKMMEIDKKGIGQEFLEILSQREPHTAIVLQRIVEGKKDNKAAFQMVVHFLQTSLATLTAASGKKTPDNWKTLERLLDRMDNDLEGL
jgi:hypothetical protein